MSRLSFSVLLNMLIDNIHNSDGKKYSISQISREVGISVNQLSLYRRGTHENPTLENIVAILDMFQMPIGYLDCTNKVDAMKMITEVHIKEPEKSPELSVRFRQPYGVDISDESLLQLKDVLGWIFAREEALKNGEEEPPLPDFSDKK